MQLQGRGRNSDELQDASEAPYTEFVGIG